MKYAFLFLTFNNTILPRFFLFVKYINKKIAIFPALYFCFFADAQTGNRNSLIGFLVTILINFIAILLLMFLTIKDYIIVQMICQGAKISQLSRSTFCSSCSKRFKSEAWGVSCFTLGGIAPSVLIFAVGNVPLTIKDYSITLGGCQAPQC